VAWLAEGRDPVMRDWANDRKNSGAFFESLQEFRAEFGSPEKIVVGLGPGSYAGVRIAISAAIGWQAAARAELVGLASISAMPCEADEYCAIGDARRQSFFCARIRRSEIIEGPALFTEEELRGRLKELSAHIPILASEPLLQFERVTLSYPSAGLLAGLARDSRGSFALPPLEPIYLREPHITMPRTAAAP
jgi:tRNA threonylcarbamoyladenosine biosynthesis protein TsaB